MKRKRIKKNVGKFEKLIYTFALIVLFAFPFSVIFLQATHSKVNIEVERIKKQIKTQERKNESLSMKINELASLDKIIEVAQKQGLRYNNNNIRLID